MKINYNLPFYSNTQDDTHCFQAALKMILKYFEPEKEFSWKDLDRFSGKADGLWTWPFAGMLWLKKNNYDVKIISGFEYDNFAKDGKRYLHQVMGEEVAKEQIAHSNIEQEERLAKEIVALDLFEKRLPTISDLQNLLEKGYLVICNVNSKMLNGENGYVGHFVVLKGFKSKTLVLHDPGLPPQENREVNFEEFEKAWAFPNQKAKDVFACKLETTKIPDTF